MLKLSNDYVNAIQYYNHSQDDDNRSDRQIEMLVRFVNNGSLQTIENDDIISIDIQESGYQEKILQTGLFNNSSMNIVLNGIGVSPDYWDNLLSIGTPIFVSYKVNGYDNYINMGCYYVTEYNKKPLNYDNNLEITSYEVYIQAYTIPVEFDKNVATASETAITVSTIISNLQTMISNSLNDIYSFNSIEIVGLEKEVSKTIIPNFTTVKQCIELLAKELQYNVRFDRYTHAENEAPKIIVSFYRYNSSNTLEMIKASTSLIIGTDHKVGELSEEEGVNNQATVWTDLIFMDSLSYDEEITIQDGFYRGTTYCPIEFKFTGDGCIEVGDVLVIRNADNINVLKYVYVMEQEFVFDGTISQKIKAFNSTIIDEIVQSPTDTLIKSYLGGNGGYYRVIDEHGNPITKGNTPAGTQWTDTDTVTSETKGWRFMLGGLYHSSDGFQNYDTFALDEDGNINASAINIGALNADVIQGNSINVSKLSGKIINGNWEIDLDNGTFSIGSISADNISSGTLTLGGASNTNGVLRVLNASSTQIGKWDKDGIAITGGTITAPTINFGSGNYAVTTEYDEWTVHGEVNTGGVTFNGKGSANFNVKNTFSILAYGNPSASTSDIPIELSMYKDRYNNNLCRITSNNYGIAFKYNTTTGDQAMILGREYDLPGQGILENQSGIILAQNLYFGDKNMGVYAKDKNSFTYPLIKDNGTNIWIGSTQTSATHHTGATYISAGYNATDSKGYPSIYVSIPNATNTGATNYQLLHKGNLRRYLWSARSISSSGTTLTGPDMSALGSQAWLVSANLISNDQNWLKGASVTDATASAPKIKVWANTTQSDAQVEAYFYVA